MTETIQNVSLNVLTSLSLAISPPGLSLRCRIRCARLSIQPSINAQAKDITQVVDAMNRTTPMHI